MNKINVKVPDREINKAIQRVKEWYGITITKKQLNNFIKKDPTLAESIRIGGDDTAAGEDVMAAITKELKLGRWPRYCDGDDALARFMPKFIRASVKAGYKISASIVKEWMNS